MKHITVKDLQPGDTFALSTRKNARQFTVHPNPAHGSSIELIGGDRYKGGPPEDHGKYLVLLVGCGQLTIEPLTPLYLISTTCAPNALPEATPSSDSPASSTTSASS